MHVLSDCIIAHKNTLCTQTANEELSVQGKRVCDVLSNVALILSSSGREEELQKRISWVESVWDQSSDSLTERLLQLQCEEQQQVSATVYVQYTLTYYNSTSQCSSHIPYFTEQ